MASYRYVVVSPSKYLSIDDRRLTVAVCMSSYFTRKFVSRRHLCTHVQLSACRSDSYAVVIYAVCIPVVSVPIFKCVHYHGCFPVVGAVSSAHVFVQRQRLDQPARGNALVSIGIQVSHFFYINYYLYFSITTRYLNTNNKLSSNYCAVFRYGLLTSESDTNVSFIIIQSIFN